MKSAWRARRAESSTQNLGLPEEGGADPLVGDLSVGYGQKLLAARAELRRRALPPRLHPFTIGLGLAVLIFTVSLVSVRILFETSEDSYKEMIRGNLIRLAKASSSLLDAELHKTFTHASQESTEPYQRAIEPLDRILNSDSEIAFVYTCVERNGRIYFVLDPTPEGDSDGDGIDDKSHVMQEYPEASPELVRALRNGTPDADIEPYEDRWGTFISGYAPIRDSTGKSVGIVGVDLAADDYAQKLAKIDKDYRRAASYSALLAILAGILAGFIQSKSIRTDRRAAERDGRYREQIASTLKRVESAMKIAEVSRNRFSELFEGIPVSCLTFDRDEHVYEWNSKAQNTFDLEAPGLMERDLLRVLGRELYGGREQGYIRRLLQGRTFNDRTWTDGSRTFLFSGHPLFGPDGEITGGILAAVDITRQKDAEDRVQTQLEDLNQAHSEVRIANERLKQANAQLEELAATDLLTGLPNRRAFYDAIQSRLAAAKRGKPFALVQADIDHFKQFNDLHGHHAGDQVLRVFADTLRASVRPGDFLARQGGEEFYIILDGTDPGRTVEIVERVRHNVASIESDFGQITASFGIAFWSPAVESDDQLMRLSDNALYEAKSLGRNRIVVANSLKKKAA